MAFDGSFFNAIASTPKPDYLGQFARGYSIFNAMPWSAENRRKQAIEDYQLQMQQQRFQQQLAMQNRDQQMQEALFPYRLAQAKRLAAGGYGSVEGDAFNQIMERIRNLGGMNTPKTEPPPAQIPTTADLPGAPIPDLNAPMPDALVTEDILPDYEQGIIPPPINLGATIPTTLIE